MEVKIALLLTREEAVALLDKLRYLDDNDPLRGLERQLYELVG